MDLKDKVAVVTGSTRGIGLAIARELAERGARVVLSGRNAERLQEVVEQFQKQAWTALAVQADVSQPEQAAQLIQKTLDKWGAVHILVNNAGITRDTLLLRMRDEDWDAVLNTNLKGAFHCTRAVARPMMKQRYGRIINISSVVGLIGNAGQANYAASKGGLIAFTKSVARELASRNITCNAVAPGYIETDMTEVLDEKVKQALLGQIPLGRLGNGKDVAHLVAFLASDLAAYITGQVINVDGGMVML
ncbi:MAG: 3-oxoacyl-[acyl-carrier-protein] reductase [Calditrichaeota bacterium]|nr:MAG: 3-oxoacyl-[acyl-carrier-protein] reductase [Calditrichota bacterium]